MAVELEQGLHVIDELEAPAPATWPQPDLRADVDADAEAVPGLDDDLPAKLDETGLEVLRDEFVEAFNARDLEALLALVHPDVEVPDAGGEGAALLAEEIESIWERSPAAILTSAYLPSSSGDGDGSPCAAGWLPDEEGGWTCAALVCFDSDGELLTLVEMPDDPEALEQLETDAPSGEELEDWADWARWDRGEETPPRARR